LKRGKKSAKKSFQKASKQQKPGERVLTNDKFYGIISHKISHTPRISVVQLAKHCDSLSMKIHVFMPKRG
jgi:hypothetical protein